MRTVYRFALRAGLKTHRPPLRDYPQFVADSSKFLTEHGSVVIGPIHAPLPQEHNGVATQNMLVDAIAWAGKHPVDELVDYKPPPVPQRQ